MKLVTPYLFTKEARVNLVEDLFNLNLAPLINNLLLRDYIRQFRRVDLSAVFTIPDQSISGATTLRFVRTRGNIALTDNDTAIKITKSGSYTITLGIMAARLIEIFIYINGNEQNRIFDVYDGGVDFSSERQCYALQVFLQENDTLHLRANAPANNIGVSSFYTRGFTIKYIG